MRGAVKAWKEETRALGDTTVEVKNGVFWDVTPCGDVSEESSASFIRVTRIGELATTLAVTSSSPILVTLIKEALSCSETSVLTRATWLNVPLDTILHSHRRENLRSYIIL
jgi:hypothetical protein